MIKKLATKNLWGNTGNIAEHRETTIYKGMHILKTRGLGGLSWRGMRVMIPSEVKNLKTLTGYLPYYWIKIDSESFDNPVFLEKEAKPDHITYEITIHRPSGKRMMRRHVHLPYSKTGKPHTQTLRDRDERIMNKLYRDALDYLHARLHAQRKV